ncbi:MAG TPA: hypothetical protein PKH79_15995 [Prolixibacteraceae bacterium]|nr:hypothetical protein [Prolixibacteraceae bacterium]
MIRFFVSIFSGVLLLSLIFFNSSCTTNGLNNKTIHFVFPLEGALFPKDFTAPTFYWEDQDSTTNSWQISIDLEGKKNFYTTNVSDKKWRPSLEVWNNIKSNSGFNNITFNVHRNQSGQLSKESGQLNIKLSTDEVGAPILYRQIPLPFSFAEKNIDKTSYSVIDVTSPLPFHNVLGSFKVCGNCHSLSGNGKTIGLDFDAVSRDKGGYFVAPVDTVTSFNRNSYLSWSKMSGRNTFGLLSRMSWNGRYIVTTVKDRVISKAIDDPERVAYSQLFFPVNGVLAVYDTLTKQLTELPGANDPEYVQSNAVWTPDDKYIVFVRAKALPFPENETKFDCFVRDEALIERYIQEKETLKFDICIIPFNEGKGGVAQPIKGASNNGKSNYFPTVSPDGKWLVFCQAENFMMLRPDSRLFILPLEGGKARKLKCNFDDMNSWHSWSPNGKWMVYVSKALDNYSDMFLTHIDEKGNASVPVLVENAKRLNCACNYPEFMNREPGFKFRMDYSFINIFDIEEAITSGKKEEAKALLDQYISQKLGTPLEYHEVARMKTLLGDDAGAAEFNRKGNELDKEFSRMTK